AASRLAMSQAALSSGSRRHSLRVATSAAAEVQGYSEDGALSWYGFLHLQAALASASLGEDPEVHLEEAREAAKSRPDDPWLMEFTPANVGVWEAATALERGDYDMVLSKVSNVDRGQLRTN